MNVLRKVFSWPLVLALMLAVVSMVWLQASSPASAQEPASISVRVVPVGPAFSIAADTGEIPVFEVGDTFGLSIVAEGVEDPGIFGSQFTLSFDTEYLNAVEDSFVPGEAMSPVIIVASQIDNEIGWAEWAASRQGDLDNVAGNVVLATISFEAIAATEPPEGQTTVIDLGNVKLGAKGGIDVPITGLANLELIIRDSELGDISGNAKVEGRAGDDQAGHSVVAIGDLGGELGTLTDALGNFFFEDAPADIYDFTANSAGFLAAVCEDVVHTDDDTTVLAGVTLLAGDINDDRVIDVTDAVAMGAAFGSEAEDEIADLNVDGIVDILDLILMSANYGQTSLDNPWVCELPTEL